MATKPKKERADGNLWEVFSLFIRLRDSNENGYCQCFTCKAWRYFRDGDCGHGVGRQHMGTKYDETNNHFQCKLCNGPGEGKKDRYKEEVNKKYGPNHWDLLELKARAVTKNGKFEYDLLTIYFQQEAWKLAQAKNLKPGELEKLKKILVN